MNDLPVVRFKWLEKEEAEDLLLPRYMTEGASGMDVCAGVRENLTLNIGEIALVPTGFSMAVPRGFEAQIRPRSGLAVKHGITIVNTPGTIDSDYRGEVKIALINLGKEPFTVKRRDRIAQMVIQRVEQVKIEIVDDLDDTKRSTGGFGHTGV